MGNFERQWEVSKAFSPSAPIDKTALFAGRIQQITTILTAVAQKGQHAIIFGERGIGKTSLANVVHDYVTMQGSGEILIAKVNCDAAITYAKLWRNILRKIPISRKQRSVGFCESQTFKSVKLETAVDDSCGPEDVRSLLEQLDSPAIIIIDEIDRIRDQDAKTKLADTIKTLSDHVVQATLILVGVADSVEQIVAEHRSIERALVQVRLPRMSSNEVYEIIDKGLSSVDMSCSLAVKKQIARLSQGLPHYTHLIALNAALNAVASGRTFILTDDLDAAISAAVDKAQQTIRSAYHKATSSAQENMYPQVLLACAIANRDDLGYFSAGDVRAPISAIMERPIQIPQFARHLKDFCKVGRGAVLANNGLARRQRFRFTDPLMEPFVIMHGIWKGLITKELITENGELGTTDGAAHSAERSAQT